MVPADSQQIPRARCYSGKHATPETVFSPTGLLPTTAGHPRPLRLTQSFLTDARAGRLEKTRPTTPHTQPLPGITCVRFSLIRVRSPLLTESLLFSLPTGTEMFHFPAFPPHTLCIQMRVTRHHSCRVSPFGHPRINARLAAPRGLSQPPTSFIGSQCQGIHHAPLNTYNDKSAQRNSVQTNLEKLHIKQRPQPDPRKGHSPARVSMLATTIHESNTTPHHQRRGDNTLPEPTDPGLRACCLKAQ